MSGRSLGLRLIKRRRNNKKSPKKQDIQLLEAVLKAYDESDVVVTKEMYNSWYWDSNIGRRGGWRSESPAVFHVDFGRRPNQKPPPISEIKEWCRIRGIPENKAYIISKNIGKNGTPPREITRRVVKQFKKAKMRASVGQNKVL